MTAELEKCGLILWVLKDFTKFQSRKVEGNVLNIRPIFQGLKQYYSIIDLLETIRHKGSNIEGLIIT